MKVLAENKGPLHMHQISHIYMSDPPLLSEEVLEWQEHGCFAVHLLVKIPSVIRFKDDTRRMTEPASVKPVLC
jgi:hypothetical protein